MNRTEGTRNENHDVCSCGSACRQRVGEKRVMDTFGKEFTACQAVCWALGIA